MKFRIILHKDEDGVYIVECLDLPGCISQGNTKEEAIANIKDAMIGYIESLKKHNEPLPNANVEEEIIELNT